MPEPPHCSRSRPGVSAPGAAGDVSLLTIPMSRKGGETWGIPANWCIRGIPRRYNAAIAIGGGGRLESWLLHFCCSPSP